MFAKTKIAVIGTGMLGEALIGGMIDAGVVKKDQFIVSDPHAPRLDFVQKKWGVKTSLSNREAVRKAGLVILCVKPFVVGNVLKEITEDLTDRHVLISVAAGIGTRFIESNLDKPLPVIRAMPNTPCLIKEGMTAVAAGTHATQSHLEAAKKMFAAIGRCIDVDEKHMDAITALGASGPAFVYTIIESLIEGGIKVGLPRDVARIVATQMVHGTANMVLQTGEHPAKLKDMVTTPGGCTIDGLIELEEGGLRVTLMKAVDRATKRARELGNG